MESVAVGPLGDGRAVVVSGDNEGIVRLWDPATGKAVGDSLRAHVLTQQQAALGAGAKARVAIGALSDGRALLMSGGGDGMVRVWDAATKTPWRRHTSTYCAITAVGLGAFSDGSVLVATGAVSGTVQLWEAATGAPFGEEIDTGTRVAAVAVGTLCDGRDVVVSANPNGVAQVWDATTGAALGPVIRSRHPRARTSTVQLDGLDAAVFGMDDGTIELWSLSTGAMIAERKGRGWQDETSITSLVLGRIANGDSVLIVGEQNGPIHAWDPTTWTAIADFNPAHAGAVLAVAIGAIGDGRALVASAGVDTIVRLWDPTTKAPPLATLRGHKQQVNAVAIGRLSDGRSVVASGEMDASVRLWDTMSGAVLATIPTLSTVEAIAINHGHIAVGLADGFVLFDLGPF